MISLTFSSLSLEHISSIEKSQIVIVLMAEDNEYWLLFGIDSV